MYKPKSSNTWILTNKSFENKEDSSFYFIPAYYRLDVDFEYPALSVNELTSITEEVEKECPYTKAVFGISGIGEGVVWTACYNKEVFRFKVKGQKHSVSKVKKLVSVDPELVKSIEEFVNYVVTDNRVSQGIQETGSTSIQDTGKFLKWFGNDVIAEELDTLTASQLEWRQVVKKVNFVARNKFFKIINNDNITK